MMSPTERLKRLISVATRRLTPAEAMTVLRVRPAHRRWSDIDLDDVDPQAAVEQLLGEDAATIVDGKVVLRSSTTAADDSEGGRSSSINADPTQLLEAHFAMAESCVAYLLLDDWRARFADLNGPEMRDLVADRTQKDLALYDYAATNWYVHAQALWDRLPDDDDDGRAKAMRKELRDPIAALCDEAREAGRLRAWFRVYQFEPQDALIRAAELGLAVVVRGLLARCRLRGEKLFPADDRKRRWPGFQALLVAAEKGWDGVVEALVGIDDDDDEAGEGEGEGIELPEAFFELVMAKAAAKGHLSTLQLLERLGWRLSPGATGKLALVEACRAGRVAVVEFLLASGVNADAEDRMGSESEKALEAAVRYLTQCIRKKKGREAGEEERAEMVVGLLLEGGAVPDEGSIVAAAWSGSVDLLRKLLDVARTSGRHAEEEIKQWLNKAAKLGASLGHGSAVDFLVKEGGVCPSSHLEKGLAKAAGCGDVFSLDVFLGLGAVDPDCEALRALLSAAREPNTTVVRRLFEKTPKYHPSVLSGVLWEFFDNSACAKHRYHVRFGPATKDSQVPRCDNADQHKDDPRWIRNRNSRAGKELLLLLIQHGALLTAEQYVQAVESALWHQLDVASRLIPRRSDFTKSLPVEGDSMADFFPAACFFHPIAALDILNDAPAARLTIDVDQPDRYGMTPLLAAAANGSLGLAAKLLDAGADPNTYTHYVPTPNSEKPPEQEVVEEEAEEEHSTRSTTTTRERLPPFMNPYGGNAFLDSPLTAALRTDWDLAELLLRMGADSWLDSDVELPLSQDATAGRDMEVDGDYLDTVLLEEYDSQDECESEDEGMNEGEDEEEYEGGRHDKRQLRRKHVVEQMMHDGKSKYKKKQDKAPDAATAATDTDADAMLDDTNLTTATNTTNPAPNTAPYHRSPITIAAARGEPSFTRFITLLSTGFPAATGPFPVNESEYTSGRTLLHHAALARHRHAAELLVRELGADVDARDAGGRTALHCAALACTIDDDDADDRDGASAVRQGGGAEEGVQGVAGVEEADVEMLNYLIIHAGADLHAVDDDGRTATDLAREAAGLPEGWPADEGELLAAASPVTIAAAMTGAGAGAQGLEGTVSSCSSRRKQARAMRAAGVLARAERWGGSNRLDQRDIQEAYEVDRLRAEGRGLVAAGAEEEQGGDDAWWNEDEDEGSEMDWEGEGEDEDEDEDEE